MGTFEQLYSQLSPDRRVRGRQFETICRWFLKTDRRFEAFDDVWLWEDWPDCGGPDVGIDLVARSRSGELWAIQAKAFSPGRSVRKRDIDSFLSASSEPQFSNRLLIATTDLLAPNARAAIRAQTERRVHTCLLSDLDIPRFNWPENPRELRAVQPEPLQPLPHQERAVADILSGLKKHERGQALMACGTGKTMVGLWVAEGLKAKLVVVTVPSLSLLSQIIQDWCTNRRRRFDYMAVCSDVQVTGSDALVMDPSELPFPTSTSPHEVARFLASDARGAKVIFSTYQSMEVVSQALLASESRVDLLVADEAHRLAGRAVGGFAAVLDENAVPCERRLFMTATPRVISDRLRRTLGEADLQVESMDDPERFGPILHRLTFAEAIEQDLLVDYRVAVIAVDDQELRGLAEGGNFVSCDGLESDARTLAAQSALARGIREYDMKRCITFHSTVGGARNFASTLPGVIHRLPEDQRPEGATWSDHVSSHMNTSQRRRRLRRLKELYECDHAVLSNARCLSEGVDVPALDGVAFIDPRRSQVDVVQAVGRVIRKVRNGSAKTIGTLVLPVFISTSEDAALALEDSSFETVWRVVRALRAHDEVLAEHLDSFRRSLGKRGEAALPDKIHIELPRTVGKEFLRAFSTRLVERTSSSWHYGFGLLLRYLSENGDTRVPGTYVTPEGFTLGKWVSGQRTDYRQGTLAPDRAEALAGLHTWSWDPYREQWEEAFAALVKFGQRHGHVRVPRHARDGYGGRLGSWIQSQRKAVKDETLLPERRARLEALPFWSWNAHDTRWELGVEALAAFVRRHGHARVPPSHIEGDVRLGTWVMSRRRERDQLSEERISLLESLEGWTWAAFDTTWDMNYEALLKYVKRFGHSAVPQSYIDEERGLKLGTWVNTQRAIHGTPREKPERMRKLEQVEGWAWVAVDAKWDAKLEELRAFAREHGNLHIPRSGEKAAPELARWISRQRTAYKESPRKISPERIARLEDIPGWSWNGERWW